MGKKVLVVYHAAFVRRLNICKNLEEHGYEIVAETENGAECLDLYRKHKPDLVILDLLTSDGMDGRELLKKLVREEPPAKVMMCSTMGQEAMQIEARLSGAADYLVVPFQAGTLLYKVRELIG